MLNITAYRKEIEELLETYTITEAIRIITKEKTLGISDCIEWMVKPYMPMILTSEERAFIIEQIRDKESVYAISKCTIITKGAPQSFYLDVKCSKEDRIIIPFDEEELPFNGMYLYKWYTLEELKIR